MSDYISKAREKDLQELSERLGVSFSNLAYLHQALTHTSYANESRNKSVMHNERLEFLGDAVVELATSTYLFKNFPKLSEGVLTKARAAAVCDRSLSRRAAELGLGEHLLMGRGELASGGRNRQSTLENTFEAVAGAIYLDKGWDVAFNYVIRQLEESLKNAAEGHSIRDYKTILQEKVHKLYGKNVSYQQISAVGPAHDRTYEYAVIINGEVYGKGTGHNKKIAEQLAACQALEKLDNK